MNTKKVITDIKTKLKHGVDEGYRKFNQDRIAPHMTGFIGARIPDVKAAMKPYVAEYRSLSMDDAVKVSQELINTGVFELRIIAYELIYIRNKEFEKKHFKVFEKWVKNNLEDWNDCDNLCTHVIGAIVHMYPELIRDVIKWTGHKKFIVRRAAAVAFIIPGRRGWHHDDIFKIADILLGDEHDLVQKGYGWMLKTASESDQKRVFNYVMKNKTKMPRTALRYAIEKMPPQQRKKCMEK